MYEVSPSSILHLTLAEFFLIPEDNIARKKTNGERVQNEMKKKKQILHVTIGWCVEHAIIEQHNLIIYMVKLINQPNYTISQQLIICNI